MAVSMALNTIKGAEFTTPTPTLNFTGTGDASIEYQLQIDTSPSFGGTVVFSDNFNDNTINTSLWVDGSNAAGTVSESGGQLLLTPTANTTGIFNIYSNSTRNLTNNGITTKVVQIAAYTTDTAFGVYNSARTDFVYFLLVTGGLSIYSTSGGFIGVVLVADAAKQYLRVRESGGYTIFEYSADGLAWVYAARVANLFDMTTVRPGYSCNPTSPVPAPGVWIFDDFVMSSSALIDTSSKIDTNFTAGHPFSSGVAKDYVVPVDPPAVTHATFRDNYYFNGNLGISDPNSVWTNDANAFNGDTTTFATGSTAGSAATNFLLGKGTSAPSSGGLITGVYVRAWIGWPTGMINGSANIYTSGLVELLGSASPGVGGYGSSNLLTVPTGGWTWSVIQSLETKLYFTNLVGTSIDFYKVELEVRSTSGLAPGTYYWRVNGNGSTWSSTQHFTVSTVKKPMVSFKPS